VDAIVREPLVWLGCALFGLAGASLPLWSRELAGRALGRIERDLGAKLRRLRASTRKLRAYVVLWLCATAAVFLGFWLGLRNLTFAVVFSAILLLAPWHVLRRMAQQHKQKIEDQLADAMVALASAVRAGLSLAQSLEILASQCPRPINAEFRQMVGDYKLGKPLDRTLTEAKERLQSENFALFAAALLASHESGGRLNETVERIAQSVLEMQRLERKIMAETAHGRKSAVYMALAPAVILVAYWFVDPGNTRLLFTSFCGQALLALALLFNVAAYLWARAILNPDI